MRRHKGLAIPLLLLAALLLITTAAQAAPQRHLLPGGLKVITSENHEAPVVAFQVWVRAGSAYEHQGEYGLTHLIEHMIFKGSPAHPHGSMARIIEGLGGETNAYTTYDHTNYYVVAASRNAPQALELLADAVANAAFAPPDLAREKEVVVEEIRMGQDDPDRRRSKAVFRLAFGDHPYGRPVIGTIDSVRAIGRQEILDYRGRWYRAPGITLVAVGDFKTAKLLPLVEKAFSGFNPAKPPKFTLPPVKVKPGPRLKVMAEPVRQAALELSWRIPGLPHPDTLALDVAAAVLGEGRLSRLYAELKEKRGLVDSVSAWAYTPEQVGLFTVSAEMSPAKAQAAWPALLDKAMELAAHPPSEAELARARVNLAAEFIRRRQTMSGQANTLGYFEVFWGGFEKQAEYLERFKEVSAAEVSRVVRKYLTPQGLSVVIQAPPGTKLPSQEQIKQHATRAYARLAPAAPAEPKASRTVLPNGLTLIVKPAHAVPTVSMVLATPGGRARESAAQAGLYQLWSRCLTRGSKKYTYQELTTALESMAGSLSAFADRSQAGLSGSFLAADWQKGLELLAEVWLNPSFPPQQIAKAKAEQAAALRAQQDSPTAMAFKRYIEMLYGSHPYGHNYLGTPQSLEGLDRAGLLAAHQKIKGPGGAVLAVVGDVEPEAVATQVRKLLAGAKGRVAPLDPGLPPAHAKPLVKAFSDPKAKQTQIILGHLAPTSVDPQRHALNLLDAILGGMGGKLFSDLRDKRSLAYAVQPFYSPARWGAAFGVYMAVGPGKEQPALAGLAQHLKAARTTPPSGQDLARAKAYILGGLAIGLQSYGAQASAMAGGELLGLGYDYYLKLPKEIEAVSAEQVLTAAKRYLDPQGEVTLTQGP